MVLPKGGLPPALVLGTAGSQRVLLIPGFKKNWALKMAYIGTVSKVQEDNITLLKTAVLVKEVFGKDRVTLVPLAVCR